MLNAEIIKHIHAENRKLNFLIKKNKYIYIHIFNYFVMPKNTKLR